MKRVFVLIFTVLSFSAGFAQQSRIISDCTVQFDLTIDDTQADADFVKTMKGATKTVYIKGSRSRTDLITPTYVQTIFNDAKSDTTIVIRELGASKYMSYLNGEKRQNQHKRFEGAEFVSTSETKTILGYECKKVIAKLKDGSSYNIFYTPTIAPSTKEYEYQFRDLPGFILEYETSADAVKAKISYVATKITLTPVPAAKFEVPKSGYRIL